MTESTKQDTKLTKEELFKQEPQNFHHKNDIALAVITNEEGAVMVHAKPMTPKEMGGFLFILQHHCSKMFYAIEAQFDNDKGLIKTVKDMHSKKDFRDFIKGKR